MDYHRRFPTDEEANWTFVALIHCYLPRMYSMDRDYFEVHPNLLLCDIPNEIGN